MSKILYQWSIISIGNYVKISDSNNDTILIIPKNKIVLSKLDTNTVQFNLIGENVVFNYKFSDVISPAGSTDAESLMTLLIPIIYESVGGGGGTSDLASILAIGNIMENGQSIISEDGNSVLKVNDGVIYLYTSKSGIEINDEDGTTIYYNSDTPLEYSKVQSVKGTNILQADILNKFDAPNNNFPQENTDEVTYFDSEHNLKGTGITPSSLLIEGNPFREKVKLGENINKGQAVYISSADGINVIVSKASNSSETTSNKIIGLLETTGVTDDILNVITEGILDGLNTITATIGDPVWLGIDGNLLYGLSNKPVAPDHLVYIGIVRKVDDVNGEILVKVQNGFQINEIHDVNTSLNVTNPVDDDKILIKENSSGLWKSLSYSKLYNRITTTITTDTIALSAVNKDYIYLCNGTLTLTLPSAISNNSTYTIKNIGTGIITVNTTTSQTIDGSSSITIPVRYTSLDLISDNENFYII